MRSIAPRRSSNTGSLLLVAASATLAFGLSSCAAEDFTRPIPDEPITPQEYAAGDTAVQAITLGGADPAFDNAQPDEDTDGDVAHLAPLAPEPVAAQITRDLEMLSHPLATAGDTIATERLTDSLEAEAPGAAASAQPSGGIGTAVSELRTCRNATGYTNGHPYTLCVTTVDGKLLGVRTANAYVRMRAAASHAGVSIRVVSGFRTMAQQRYLYHLYVTGHGNLAARPGYSNHQSGIALDLNTASGSVYRWLANHGARFGFRRTVPSEMWHWEYRP